MRTALGFKTHSGWAALVAVGEQAGRFHLIERRKVELVQEAWAKQPYHAAEELPPEEARQLVGRGIEAALQGAQRELEAAVLRLREAGHEIVSVAVVAGEPMPPWSCDEILAVHFRMHKAEGLLFQDALLAAARSGGMTAAPVREKDLHWDEEAVATLGRGAGPPWGKDQKLAASAALAVMRLRKQA